MKTKLIALVAAMSAIAAAAADFNNAWIKGETDKGMVEYKVGDEMTLTLTPQGVKGEIAAGEYLLALNRSGDDGVSEGKYLPFDGKPIVYRTKFGAPGFIRVFARVVEAETKKDVLKKFTGDASTPEGKRAMNQFERQPKQVFFDGGAGAEIEKLANREEPKDFDEFWRGQFARLDKIPLKSEMVEMKSPNPKVNFYAVTVQCAGLRPVTGYLTVPKDVASGRRYPCKLSTRGYDGYKFDQDVPGWAPTDCIWLYINAHGLKLPEFGGTEADRKALSWEASSHDMSYAFDPKQNADPEVAYFNGMVLRVKRALQFLKSQKGWNGKDLWAEGGSQGGLQTIWAAACGEGVTKAFSCVTWCCDLGGELTFARNRGGLYIHWADGLGYYDAVNWAKRIPKSCFTEITRAGLGDYTCPPSGLAALWNVLDCPKKITWVQGSQHGYVPPDYPGRDAVYESAK